MVQIVRPFCDDARPGKAMPGPAPQPASTLRKMRARRVRQLHPRQNIQRANSYAHSKNASEQKRELSAAVSELRPWRDLRSDTEILRENALTRLRVENPSDQVRTAPALVNETPAEPQNIHRAVVRIGEKADTDICRSTPGRRGSPKAGAPRAALQPFVSSRQTLSDSTRRGGAISGSRALHRAVLWLPERLRRPRLAFRQSHRFGEFRQHLGLGARREAS
ncbi:hypothetical protein LPU83_pLPU83d_1064 (plasmid) [Rhizobium favelukesii]|uniref:Uncharacterized protein n=1 Tax=Rhizobium favelukesii TaxID=348824 RepID=W6RNY2_9HYPH|nr:hypothetical protein LPU83_pLPU83d_1064 [Rhizobium favelukesii]